MRIYLKILTTLMPGVGRTISATLYDVKPPPRLVFSIVITALPADPQRRIKTVGEAAS